MDEDENIEDDEEAEDFLTPALLAIQSEEPLANITSILTACGLVEPELVTSKESSSSSMPSKHPPEYPSMFPSSLPSLVPSQVPSVAPSGLPSELPSELPSRQLSSEPSQESSLRSSPAPSRRKNQAQCYQSSQDQSRRSSHRNTHRCFRLHCPHWFEDGVCFDQYYREMQNSTFQFLTGNECHVLSIANDIRGMRRMSIEGAIMCQFRRDAFLGIMIRRSYYLLIKRRQGLAIRRFILPGIILIRGKYPVNNSGRPKRAAFRLCSNVSSL